jgi:hypothetical protein
MASHNKWYKRINRALARGDIEYVKNNIGKLGKKLSDVIDKVLTPDQPINVKEIEKKLPVKNKSSTKIPRKKTNASKNN